MEKRGYSSHLIKTVNATTGNEVGIGKELTLEIKTNQGIRHDYALSPTLFNINIETL